MKQLVVTADDLGLHRGMTDGAVRAHRSGIVTACSISACGDELEYAVERVGQCPSLDAGIHFTLVEERPVLPAAQVPSLVRRDGRFLSGYLALLARYALRRLNLDEVENELRAQVDRLRKLGVSLIHANGHQHLHVLPGIVERVVKVAREAGIKYVRIPVDARDRSSQGPRALAIRLLARVADRAGDAVRGAGMAANDKTIGIYDAGRLHAARIVSLLDGVEGVTELVTHPGEGTAMGARYAWGYWWQQEADALCDPSLRDAIRERGIELTTIRQVVDSRGIC
jgi:chitin disaccharide deacetylase